MKVNGKYISQDISGLSSFLCHRMNLTVYCISLTLLICCLVQISKPRTKRKRESSNVLTRIVEAFKILPPGKDESSLSKTVYNFYLPIIPDRIFEPLNPPQVTGQSILTKVGSSNLVSRSTRLYVKRRALREHCLAVPDPVTELRKLKAQVNRRFLVCYDCSSP